VTSDSAPRETPRVAAPLARSFDYTVRLEVAIPLAWAQALKTVGEHHYDYKCREVSKCGVVNGLLNTALFNEDPEVVEDVSSRPSTHPISRGDCDIMLKIMEQAHCHAWSASPIDPATIGSICAWLRRTMDQIERRHGEISGGVA